MVLPTSASHHVLWWQVIDYFRQTTFFAKLCDFDAMKLFAKAFVIIWSNFTYARACSRNLTNYFFSKTWWGELGCTLFFSLSWHHQSLMSEGEELAPIFHSTLFSTLWCTCIHKWNFHGSAFATTYLRQQPSQSDTNRCLLLLLFLFCQRKTILVVEVLIDALMKSTEINYADFPDFVDSTIRKFKKKITGCTHHQIVRGASS